MKEDFPDQPWISKLLFPINDFFENTYFALNNNLTIGENVGGEFRDLSVVGGQFPVDFVPTFRGKKRPKAVLIGKIEEDNANPGIIAGPTTLQWSELSDGSIRLRDISNLSAGVRYNVTLVVFPAS